MTPHREVQIILDAVESRLKAHPTDSRDWHHIVLGLRSALRAAEKHRDEAPDPPDMDDEEGED